MAQFNQGPPPPLVPTSAERERGHLQCSGQQRPLPALPGGRSLLLERKTTSVVGTRLLSLSEESVRLEPVLGATQ